MIRLLLYLGFVLLGAVVAPMLLEHKGYVLINFGQYTLETTTLAFSLIVLLTFGGLQAVFWLGRRLKLIFLQSEKM